MVAYTYSSSTQERRGKGAQDHKLEVSLDYIVSSRPPPATLPPKKEAKERPACVVQPPFDPAWICVL